MESFIYVSNVSNASELTALEDLFLTVGDVKNQKLEVIAESGHRMGFGVFEMSTRQQALDCVERFNGTINDGKQLAVTFIRPKRRPAPVPKKGAQKRGR